MPIPQLHVIRYQSINQSLLVLILHSPFIHGPNKEISEKTKAWLRAKPNSNKGQPKLF